MIYVLRLKDILYILRHRRGTNVERMLSNLTKSGKIARKTHFCKNQWEGKSNEEFVDGGAGNGRSAPCGGKLKE